MKARQKNTATSHKASSIKLLTCDVAIFLCVQSRQENRVDQGRGEMLGGIKGEPAHRDTDDPYSGNNCYYP